MRRQYFTVWINSHFKKYANKSTPNPTLAPHPQSRRTLLDPKAGPWIHLQQATGNGCHGSGLSPPEPTCRPPAWLLCSLNSWCSEAGAVNSDPGCWPSIRWVYQMRKDGSPRTYCHRTQMNSDSNAARIQACRGLPQGSESRCLMQIYTLKRQWFVLKQFNISYEMRRGNMPVLRPCWWVECRNNRERLLESLYEIYRLKSKKKGRHFLMYFS